MSREVMAELSVRPRSADPSEHLEDAPPDLSVVPGPVERPQAAVHRTGRRGRLLVGAGVALLALVGGAVAGAAEADRSASAALVAATRVLLRPASAASADGTLPVRVEVAGAPVRLERVDLGVATATLPHAPTVSPGHHASADLHLSPRCPLPARTPADLLSDAHAVVRVLDTGRETQVPLDVVGDPGAVVAAIAAACTRAANGSHPTVVAGVFADADPAAGVAEAGEGDGTGDAPALVTVSGLAATRTGDLTFTVRAPAGRPATFGLTVARPADASLHVTISGRPALPLRLGRGQSRRVTVHVTVRCSRPDARIPATYGLLQPSSSVGGTPSAADDGQPPVDGWDDATAAAAVTAAVLSGCPAR